MIEYTVERNIWLVFKTLFDQIRACNEKLHVENARNWKKPRLMEAGNKTEISSSMYYCESEREFYS